MWVQDGDAEAEPEVIDVATELAAVVAQETSQFSGETRVLRSSQRAERDHIERNLGNKLQQCKAAAKQALQMQMSQMKQQSAAQWQSYASAQVQQMQMSGMWAGNIQMMRAAMSKQHTESDQKVSAQILQAHGRQQQTRVESIRICYAADVAALTAKHNIQNQELEQRHQGSMPIIRANVSIHILSLFPLPRLSLFIGVAFCPRLIVFSSLSQMSIYLHVDISIHV